MGTTTEPIFNISSGDSFYFLLVDILSEVVSVDSWGVETNTWVGVCACVWVGGVIRQNIITTHDLMPNCYKFAKAAKHHLPTLQLFHIQPSEPKSHFQSLFFLSLSPPTANPRTSSSTERKGQRRWGERLNLAFREWLGLCLEIFHILFTPGRFQPGTAGSWQGPPPGHSFSICSLPPSFKDLTPQTVPRHLLPIKPIKPKTNKQHV